MKHSAILSGLGYLSTVLAAPYSGTRAVPQVANFDDIEGVNPVLGFSPPDGYKFLSYTAFGLGAPIPKTLTIQASSANNAVFAPYLLTDPLATPRISVSYPGSKTTAFDMHSTASGCYAATQNGALAPATSCTIRYTGTKRNGSKVVYDYEYRVRNVDLAGTALSAEKVRRTMFPSRFRDLVSLEPEVVDGGLLGLVLGEGVVAQMAFDDLAYTAYVEE